MMRAGGPCWRELGVAPDAATERLRDDIRDDAIPDGYIGRAEEVTAPTRALATAGDLPAVRHRAGKAAVTGEMSAAMPLAGLALPDGAWRRVTVVASEITGSASLRATVGFEDWVWCLAELLRVAGAEVRTLGGASGPAE